jgi:hypothetical protein
VYESLKLSGHSSGKIVFFLEVNMTVEKEQVEKKENNKRKKHEYHFVMAKSMINDLIRLGVYRGAGSFSKVIEKILLILIPAVTVEQEWGKQRENRYRLISEDPSDPRVDASVYLPEKVYRLLKQVHSDLNFYSMAGIVREVIGLFISLVKEYGKDGVIPYLKSQYKRWKEEAESSQLTVDEFVPHMLRTISCLPNLKGMITIYDENYIPFYYYRL